MLLAKSLIILITIVVYYFLFSEKIERTVISMFGAVLCILIGEQFSLFNTHEILLHIDFEVLILLFSMMIITEIMKKTGLFEYIAALVSMKFYKKPVWIVITLLLATAYISMILDNVTTLLIILPVSIHIAKLFRINLAFFLTNLAVFSNIGGIGTLIGDPPNIIIGSAANFSFLDFLKNLFLPVSAILLISAYFLYRFWSNRIKPLEKPPFDMEKLAHFIKNKDLLRKELILIGIMLLLFIVWGHTSLVAMIFACLFILVSREKLETHGGLLINIEWSSLIFFAALFVLIGVLDEIGVLKFFASYLGKFLISYKYLSVFLLLFVSAVISALLDNIPFTVSMVKVLKYLIADGILTPKYWWILALGVGLGGNLTPIGASGNVIIVGKLKQLGYKITFKDWFKFTFLVTLLSLVLALIYSYWLVF